MNLAVWPWMLLAQISKWRHLGDGLHRSRGRVELVDLLPYILAALLLTAILFALSMYHKRNDFSQPGNDPDKLFRELSRAHNLDFSSRRLLRELALAYQLEQPAEVFLQPAALRPDRLPDYLLSKQAEVRALQQQLFG